MILLWRTRGTSPDAWRRYCHLWFKFAADAGESVYTRPWTGSDVRQEWDRVNLTPGRLVAWIKPTFIPSLEFFDELDHYLDEGYRIVIHTLDGQLDDSLIVFQLAGQTKIALPTPQQVDPMNYLAAPARHILHLPLTTIINGPHRVSRLGAVFSECSPTWNLYMDGWSRWIEAKWRQK